jgi:regulator of replication initiation timing
LIRESKPHIEKRDAIKDQIYKINAQTKKVKGPIPKILEELKNLQLEMDEYKKQRDTKNEVLDGFDKNLERISDKKKQHWDEKDKLRK